MIFDFALNSSDFADNFEAFTAQNGSKDAPHNAGNSDEDHMNHGEVLRCINYWCPCSFG